MNTNSEGPRPLPGMDDREQMVWSFVYTRYVDDPGLAVMKANQAVVGLRAQDLDGPPEEVWVEPSRKGMRISFENWKVWYPISFELQYSKVPSTEQIAADFSAFERGRSDFW